MVGLDTPKLQVPRKFETTKPDRGWIINPFSKNPPYMWIAALLPALLATILIFMDQQITAVIINRKENKLKVIKFSFLLSKNQTFQIHRKDAVIILIY